MPEPVAKPRPPKAEIPKWKDKCPFCRNEEKERRKSGSFSCSECKAVFYNEEHEDIKLRSRFTGITLPYNVRKFKRNG